jgi:hypothetical protein
MIDIPARFAVGPLALGRFCPVLVETTGEQLELEAFLGEERGAPVRPDLLDGRPSTFAREHLTIAHYRPSQARWPYVQLCQWPAEFVSKASSTDPIFARGAYTYELFRDRGRLERATRLLLTSLERRQPLRIETVFPDWSSDPGASPH